MTDTATAYRATRRTMSRPAAPSARRIPNSRRRSIVDLRDQTVKAERRERETQDRQQAEHPREHPLLAQLTVDAGRQRSRGGERDGACGACGNGVRNVPHPVRREEPT